MTYVFTSDRNLNQMLRRETVETKDYKELVIFLNCAKEFVKQTIGHSSLNSTSSYVNQMADHF